MAFEPDSTEELEFPDLLMALLARFPDADQTAFPEALSSTDGSTEQMAAVVAAQTGLEAAAATELVEALRFGRPDPTGGGAVAPGDEGFGAGPEPHPGGLGSDDLMAGSLSELLQWAGDVVHRLADAAPTIEARTAELRRQCEALAAAQQDDPAGKRPGPTVGGAVGTSVLLSIFGWLGRG